MQASLTLTGEQPATLRCTVRISKCHEVSTAHESLVRSMHPAADAEVDHHTQCNLAEQPQHASCWPCPAISSAATAAARAVACCRMLMLCRYTLDLNSELSAFDGHLLSQQAEFAAVCLAQLKAMYSIHSSTTGNGQPSSSSLDISRLPYNLRPQLVASASGSSGGSSSGAAIPAGILLVGHSMGGVVARAAAAAALERPDLGEQAPAPTTCCFTASGSNCTLNAQLGTGMEHGFTLCS